VDKEFLDPADCYYVYGQAPPAPQKHSGYWADPRVWCRINRVAARLTDGPPPPSRELVEEVEQTGLAVKLDRGGDAVEVPAAKGAITVNGEGGEVGG
jgi:hypothetical protein